MTKLISTKKMSIIKTCRIFMWTRKYFASTMGFRVKLSVIQSLFCEIEITTISRIFLFSVKILGFSVFRFLREINY